MNLQTIQCGAFSTNCYILEHKDTVLVIDPNGKAQKLIDRLQDRKVTAILLTHGHFDHIGAVDDLVKYYQCPVYVHPSDQVLLEDETLNSMSGYTAHVRSKTEELDEGTIRIGDIPLQILHAPGHTPGSVLIFVGKYCFCGDVVFSGSIGRTDLPLGSESQMRQTLKMIRTLDPDTVFYPGHGPATTLSNELQVNPFLRTHR